MPRSAYSRRGMAKTAPSPDAAPALPPLPPSSPTAPPADYHYVRSNPRVAQPTTDQLVVDTNRRWDTEDTMNAIPTMSRTHKSNFSVAALLSGQPEAIFRPRSRQHDPKPLGNNSEGSGGSSRTRFGSQGPHETAAAAATFAGSSGAANAVAPWMALELPTGSPVELRNPQASAISLKLKIPTFKGLVKTRSRSDDGHRTPALVSRPQTPISIQSSIFNTRSSLSNDTFALGAIQFKNTDPGYTYIVPSRGPNSEEGSNPSCSTHSSPPFSTTSTLCQEEPMPPTPCTTRSEFPPRHGTPILSGNSTLSHRDENDDSKYNTYLIGNLPSPFHNAEFVRESRRRSLPTTTSQDDMSLINLETVAEKRKSINRMGRRASVSVSVTSMLSSSSSSSSAAAPLHLQSSSSTSRSDGDRKYAEHTPLSASTPTGTGFITGVLDMSPVTPLSPITFQSIPSSQLDLTRIPLSELVEPPPPPPPSKDYNDSAPTPTVSSHPDIPFDAMLELAKPTSLRSGRSSPPQSRSTLRNRSLASSTSRSATPEVPSITRIQIKKTTTTTTHAPAQKLEEQEEQSLKNEIVQSHSGEACVIRFEPKHGWMGFWNRSDMDSVIDELRELRLPKLSA